MMRHSVNNRHGSCYISLFKFKSFCQFNTPQIASNFRHLLSCGTIVPILLPSQFRKSLLCMKWTDMLDYSDCCYQLIWWEIARSLSIIWLLLIGGLERNSKGNFFIHISDLFIASTLITEQIGVKSHHKAEFCDEELIFGIVKKAMKNKTGKRAIIIMWCTGIYCLVDWP